MLLPVVTPFAFESLLSFISTSQSPAAAVAAAARTHSQLLTNGLLPPSSSSAYLSTKLLQLYADGDDLSSALHLFDALPHPNIFAWTPIIAFLSRSGDHRRCLSTYSRMRVTGIPPDGYVLPVALRSSVGCSLLAAAALHAEAVKFAMASNIHVSNALISAYSDSGDAVSSGQVFDSMTDRNLLSWNSVISAFGLAGFTNRMLGFLRSMEADGREPDIVTWNAVLDGCCRAGRCVEAAAIFNRLAAPNAVSYTVVILGHSRSGNHEAALGFFRRMVGAGGVRPDLDALSCAVACCRHAGAIRAGREVHAFGIKTVEFPAFYRSAGAALVALYAGSKSLAAAARVSGLMDSEDPAKQGALVAGLCHAGMIKEALDHFGEEIQRGIRTSPEALASLLPVCSMIQGRQIHAYAIRNYDAPAIEVCNALISAYARCGFVAAARQLFSSAAPAGDVVTWNAMIAAYGSHGLAGPAMELAREMMLDGPQPNIITFTSVLAACSRSGLVDAGLEWFERFRNEVGLAPTEAHYTCIVDMLARTGRFENAIQLIRAMPVGAGACVWGTLMAASRVHQTVEFGKIAFDELLKIEPENAGNYVTMAGMYLRAGQWEEAKMVRKMMERRCAVKPIGYSRLDME